MIAKSRKLSTRKVTGMSDCSYTTPALLLSSHSVVAKSNQVMQSQYTKEELYKLILKITGKEFTAKSINLFEQYRPLSSAYILRLITALKCNVGCREGLQEINLSKNEITVLLDFSDFSALRTLMLFCCKLKQWPNLNELPSLEVLYLSGNELATAFDLSHLENLRELRITHNKLRVPPNILGCEQLIKCHIAHENPLTDLGKLALALMHFQKLGTDRTRDNVEIFNIENELQQRYQHAGDLSDLKVTKQMLDDHVLAVSKAAPKNQAAEILNDFKILSEIFVGVGCRDITAIIRAYIAKNRDLWLQQPQRKSIFKPLARLKL